MKKFLNTVVFQIFGPILSIKSSATECFELSKTFIRKGYKEFKCNIQIRLDDKSLRNRCC